jgi:HAD superfamily hydrolase (TIGR01549 family)
MFMIRGVVFDLDGTLIDSAEAASLTLSDTFQEFGYSIQPSEIRKFVGLSSKAIASKFMGNLTRDDVERIRSIRKRYNLKNMDRIIIFPDVVSCISNLTKMGIKVSIASSMGNDLIDEVVKHFSIDRMVCCWVSIDEVKNPKPEPDVFLKAFEKMELMPRECISVGDREYDIIAGNRAGSLTALIARDLNSQPGSEQPDYTIKDLIELPAIVNRINSLKNGR